MSATATKPRKVRARDLSKAITLRPSEVFQLYGMAPDLVNRWCRRADATDRLPSLFIKEKKGKRGIRLINHDDLRAFLARHAA